MFPKIGNDGVSSLWLNVPQGMKRVEKIIKYLKIVLKYFSKCT